MQNVLTGREEYALREEVPVGARVSWQAGWAGTLTSLSLATLLWALALAIIPLTMRPTAGSLRGAAIAGWICLMLAVVIASFFGGLVASRVRGSPRMRVGLLHGFITWALTLVLGVLFSAFFMRGLLVGLINALPDVMTATPMATVDPEVEAAGRAAVDYLRGFGWSWFGTWFVSLLLALAGAAAGVRRTRRSLEPERVERPGEIPPISPLTPAPSA
jgi:hypothetical protein